MSIADKYKDYAIKCESQEEADKVVELLGVGICGEYGYGNLNWLNSPPACHLTYYHPIGKSRACIWAFVSGNALRGYERRIPAAQVIAELTQPDEFQLIGKAFEHNGKWWSEVKRGTKVEYGADVLASDDGVGWWGRKFLAPKINQEYGYHWVTESSSGGVTEWERLAIQAPTPTKKITRLTVSEIAKRLGLEGELAIVEDGV